MSHFAFVPTVVLDRPGWKWRVERESRCVYLVIVTTSDGRVAEKRAEMAPESADDTDGLNDLIRRRTEAAVRDLEGAAA